MSGMTGPRTPDAWRDLAAEDLAGEADAPDLTVAEIYAADRAGWIITEPWPSCVILRHPEHGELYRAVPRMWRWVPPGAVVAAASFVSLASALEFVAGAQRRAGS